MLLNTLLDLTLHDTRQALNLRPLCATFEECPTHVEENLGADCFSSGPVTPGDGVTSEAVLYPLHMISGEMHIVVFAIELFIK